MLNIQFGFQTDMHILPAVVLSVTGVLLAATVMLLPSRRLRLFYTGLCAIAILLFSFWWNREFTQRYLVRRAGGSLELLQSRELYLYSAVTLVYVAAHRFLMNKCFAGQNGPLRQALVGALFFLPGIIPVLLPEKRWQLGPVLGLSPADLALKLSKGLLLTDLVALLLSKLGWARLATRFAYAYCQHCIKFYGLQYFLEDQWSRLRVPSVLRLFWLTRLALQVSLLLGTVGTAHSGDTAHGDHTAAPTWPQVLSNLLVSGCDTILAVSGMSAVISYACHCFGVCVQKIIGEKSNDEELVGTISAILFFILALQTGLTGLPSHERFTPLSRNFFLLFTAILHFVHNMASPVLMSLSAQHITVVSRHLRVLLVCLALLTFSPWFMHALWTRHSLGTWLLAVSCFCLEVCIKTLVTLTVYALFMVDARPTAPWERLDDYVYYVRAAGNSVEFLFGLFLLFNGAWILFFESGGVIQASMMCMHAYFNIWQQARQDWQVFTWRRSGVAKINCLPDATPLQLKEYKHPCAVCYQRLNSAKVTACRHYFHSICLRKWLYVQDRCPLCHILLY